MSIQKHHFQKLTPIDDVKLGIYEEAIEYAFSNDDICNFAISGSYGAGKSSVIETYKKVHPEKKFLHISLAHFEEIETKNDKETTNLEGKIINQLAHQISPDSIPQTYFRIKQEVEEEKVWKYTLFTMAFILLLCFLCFNEAWCNMVNGLSSRLMRNLLVFSTTKEMALVVGIGCLIMALYLCYALIKQQMNRNILKRVNVKGNNFDIELFDGENDSYFDKYLNEVLYLFEKVNVDAIVFEDLDRYNTNLIFEKLREINTLFNRRLKRLNGEKKEPLRFIYQLRDDMFLTKERTKFFDFIIPIVPVVDGSNALDKFLDFFAIGGISELFDKDFLQDLSLYVDDMRILKNICNEFLIYHEKLQESPVGQDDNKLLAMITYKNIFPKDFADLQVARGYVYHLFEQKDTLAKDAASQIQSKIDLLQEEERSSAKELVKNLNELDALYFTDSRVIKVGGKLGEQFSDRAKFVEAIKENNYDVSIEGRDYYGRISSKPENIKAKFDNLLSNEEYVKRKKDIENKEKRQKTKRQMQILKYKGELENVQMAYLKNLITKENERIVFCGGGEQFDSIRKDTYFPLIKYLIKEGYIDETYSDYMTFFYENSITMQDKAFLLSVKDEKAKNPEHPLQNTDAVIKGLRLVDFEKEECQNYDLLDALLLNHEKYREQLNRMLCGLCDRQTIGFVEGYILRGKNLRAFSMHLNEQWEWACAWILEEEFDESARRQYILHTLCENNESALEASNQENELTSYISNAADFLSISTGEEFVLGEDDKDNFINSLIALNVEFCSIDFEDANEELLREVYEYSLYALNKEMIVKVLIYFYQIPFSGKYLSQRLSLIFSQEQPLATYVKANLADYIRMQIQEGGLQEESEETVLYVLNHETLEMELKRKFVQMLTTRLAKLSDVQNKELWEVLLANNVLYTQQNLLDYFFLSGNGMDEVLTSCINSWKEGFLMNRAYVEETYEKGAQDTLFWAIVKNNEIENGRYRQSLKGLNMYSIKFATKGIANDKMQILIQDKVIRMTLENLIFLRENYKNSIREFIGTNIQEYLGIITEKNLVLDEVEYVLQMDIADADKIKLLKLTTDPISVINKNYSDAVTAHILQHNLDGDEKETLYNWYPTQMPKVCEVIRKFAVEDIDAIVSMRVRLAPELLDSLIKAEKITPEDKKQLLAKGIENLSKEKVREYLNMLNLRDFSDLFEGKRPKFEISVSNESLLAAFKAKKWISSFDVDKEDVNMYRAYGRKK